jgi:hypothetical protein
MDSLAAGQNGVSGNFICSETIVRQVTENVTFQALARIRGRTSFEASIKGDVGSNHALDMAAQGPPTCHGRAGIGAFPEDGSASRSNGQPSL